MGIRDQIRQLIQAHGVKQAATLVGLGHGPLLRLAAGARVQTGTIALAQQGLARLEAQDAR